MTTPIASFQEPSEGPGSRGRRIAFFAISGVALVAILATFRAVLVPFVLALLVAYVLAPLVTMLERVRLGKKPMPRWGAVLIIYAVLLGTLGGLLTVGVPRLVFEVEKLGREIPRLVSTAREDWIPNAQRALQQVLSPYVEVELAAAADPGVEPSALPTEEETLRVVPRPDGSFDVVLPPKGIAVTGDPENGWRITQGDPTDAPLRPGSSALQDAVRTALANGEQHAFALVATVQTIVRALATGIFVFSITLMMAAYLLITSDRVFEFFRSLVRVDARREYDDLLRRIDRGLSGVVRGQLIICVVNGVLSGIGFWALGLDYWPILTLFATVLSIIPIFGAFLSSVPAVIIGLQDGIGVALLVLGWIIIIHQIEANFLNPKIMGDSAKVHPVLVIFALLAGEHFFGIMGALLAVPVLSITQSLFLHFRMVALGIPSTTTAIIPPPPDAAKPPTTPRAPDPGSAATESAE